MHRKASPIFHNGQKILRLSDLPSPQAYLFCSWISDKNYVTLGEENDFDCVDYVEYEYWYQNHYATEKDFDTII